MTTRALRSVLCFAALFSLAACGSPASSENTPRAPGQAEVTLPSMVLGLNVVEEDVVQHVENLSDTYLDSVGLFSLREEDNLLRASLQVARFSSVTEQPARFRDEIIGQLGTSVPREMRLGEQLVWLTTGNEQSVFAWFSDKGFFVLSVRDDYDFPRTLLRKLVEAEILT